MKCPSCGYEPTDALLQSPCPICSGGWMDTYEYVSMLAGRIDKIETALDVGCGNKGVIAQHFWEHVKPIKRGYACDRWVLKPLPALWTPLLCDVEHLPTTLDPVDFVTHCGMLEHVEYEKAFRVLEAIEKLTGKFCFFTCSAELRQVDYKVKRDGNPYHYYRSWWDARTFELLGYHVDRDRMISGQTFRREVVGWFDKIAEPFATRVDRAKQHIAERRCCIPGCGAEPIAWDCRERDNYYCIVHYVEHGHDGRGDVRDVEWWLEQPNVEELLKDCRPPWRDPLQPLAR